MRREPPKELQDLSQWCVWFYLRRESDITKPPCNPLIDPRKPLEERLARPNNPATWGTYQQAKARYLSSPRVYRGIGFFFSADDPYCGVDLDGAIIDGQLTPWAVEIVQLLHSYTEVSPSRTGVHIFLRASLQTCGNRHKDATGRLEVYDQLRYFTWTGRHLQGTPYGIEPRQRELNALYQRWFPLDGPAAEAPVSQPPLELSDQDLINRACLARGGNGERFARLWRGDRSDYRDPTTGKIDESRADLALLAMLAYWTRRDPLRMETLFKQSGLFRPDRWKAPARSGETYGQGSIRVAIERCQRIYDPQWKSR